MAIQFPKDGIYPGYTFDFTDKYDGTTTYIWDGQAWNAVIKQVTGPKGEKGSDGEHGVKGDMAYVWIQDDAPAIGDTAAGDLWWSPKWGQLYISYDDGNSFQWVVSNAQSTGKKGEKGEFKGEKGAKGQKGEKFLFDDFTEEDREVIKGEKGAKGEVGREFQWDDFTDEQLEAIKGEKGEKGQKGEVGREFQWDDFTDEQLEAIKGEKGAKGEKGEVGREFQWDDFTDSQLDSIKGEKGQKGREFVYNDFTQTELDSIKGEPGNVTFPAGTRMLFAQANPPTGWTVDDSFTNHGIRVTNTAGFSTGAGGSVSFTDVFKSQSVSGSGSGSNTTDSRDAGGGGDTGSRSISANVENHQLNESRIPSHQHDARFFTDQGGGNLNYQGGTAYGNNTRSTTWTGGNQDHNHGFSQSSHNHSQSGGGSHSHPFSVTVSFSDSINLSLQYANVVIGVY